MRCPLIFSYREHPNGQYPDVTRYPDTITVPIALSSYSNAPNEFMTPVVFGVVTIVYMCAQVTPPFIKKPHLVPQQTPQIKPLGVRKFLHQQL